MLQNVSDVPEAAGENITGSTKTCRIPQRVSPLPLRHRTPTVRTRPINGQEIGKSKNDSTFHPGPKTLSRSGRTDENKKSTNQCKDETLHRPMHPTHLAHQSVIRNSRIDREKPAGSNVRKTTLTFKREPSDCNSVQTKYSVGRPVILVPVSTKQMLAKSIHTAKNAPNNLPDQETITRKEQYELHHGNLTETSLNRSNSTDLNIHENDDFSNLTLNWQEMMLQYDNLKSDLIERQKAILKLYSKMRATHDEIRTMGQDVVLPTSDDLQLMNVTNLTPDQLLQLCSSQTQKTCEGKARSPVTVDLNKLYNMPSGLIATCEQTLSKRKEIIDWFEDLKNKEKGISLSALSKKINEFNSENDMLKSLLDQGKSDFCKDLNEMIDLMRNGVHETMTLQLNVEELTHKISELKSQNLELRKQVHTAEHLKPHLNRKRIEDLEKEIKEEKCKKILMRDRLNRVEGQLKINMERVSQLESSLDQSYLQNKKLEYSVQQLQNQNTSLQSQFDLESNKLKDIIKTNTINLEEISHAREKLQEKKEDLEKRLLELSATYDESMNSLRTEINTYVVNVAESDKRYNVVLEEKKILENKVEIISAQLSEIKLRCEDLQKQLKESQSDLHSYLSYKSELENTQIELSKALSEIENQKKKYKEQTDQIEEIKRNLHKSLNSENFLKREVEEKDSRLKDLESKRSILEQQLNERQCKMESYFEELTLLKEQIKRLQSDFGMFENIDELNEMLKQQSQELRETTTKNNSLKEKLQEKEFELSQRLEHIGKQEKLLEERNNVIKLLSEKQEEYLDIIKLLRNNIEMRLKADVNVDQQINDKNVEIQALVENLETRKAQICQMEKIILTLEDQARKLFKQKQRDKERIELLESKIMQKESYHNEKKCVPESCVDNLDNLMTMLEDELGATSSFQEKSKEIEFNNKCKITESKEINMKNKQNEHKRRQEVVPEKIAISNNTKKTCVRSSDIHYNADIKDRKKIFSDAENFSLRERKNRVEPSTPSQEESYFFSEKICDDNSIKESLLNGKNIRMYKLAAHKI